MVVVKEAQRLGMIPINEPNFTAEINFYSQLCENGGHTYESLF